MRTKRAFYSLSVKWSIMISMKKMKFVQPKLEKDLIVSIKNVPVQSIFTTICRKWGSFPGNWRYFHILLHPKEPMSFFGHGTWFNSLKAFLLWSIYCWIAFDLNAKVFREIKIYTKWWVFCGVVAIDCCWWEKWKCQWFVEFLFRRFTKFGRQRKEKETENENTN